MSIFWVVLILLSSLLLHALPNLTRPGLFFAVTVDPAFRRTGSALRILAVYRTIIWIVSAAAIGLELSTGFAMAALLVWVAGFLGALAVAHHRTLPHAASPNPIREVDLTAPRETLPGGLPMLFAPTASLIVLGIWVSGHRDRLPQRLAVHLGVRSVYGLLAVYAALSLGIMACSWGVLHWSRRISTAGAPAASERRFRRNILLLLLVVSCFLAAQAWIALLRPSAVAMGMLSAALGAVTVAFLIVLIRAGQGGRGASGSDRTPDECWKWGIVYYNPADPSVFVEKRFGIGYTFNFGNRWSWALLALLLVPAVLARFLLKG